MQRNERVIASLVFVILVFVLSAFIVSAEPSARWIKTFGGVGDDEGLSVEAADDGYGFVGITNSSGFGQYDVLLVKTDSSGAMDWNRTYGGSSNDVAYSLVATEDGGFAFGGSTTSFGAGSADFWLVKADSLGNMEWNQTYGGQYYDSCRSLIATSDGGYALLGFTTYSDSISSPFNLGNSDVWLVKVDSAGNMEWNQTYGGSGSDSVSTLIETADGGYALGCSTSSFGAGGADFWLIKVDSAGNIEWNKTYGGAGTEFANTLVVTDDDGYAFAGGTSSFGAGSADVWLIKVDSFGNIEWNQTYGGPIADYCDSIVSLGDNGYALACITQPPTFGDGTFWLIKVDSLGGVELNQTYGVSAHHSHTSLLTTADDNYILGGSTRDEFGHRDFWLAEIGEADSGTEFLFSVSIIIVMVIVLIVVIVYRKYKP